MYNDLSKKNISILSNNCIAGFLYHEYKLPFLSPTINLQIVPDDFVKFIYNINQYIDTDMEEITNPDDKIFNKVGGGHITFPVGKINDITVLFQHYKEFNEAKEKWDERKKRINYSNIYIILVEHNSNCTAETIHKFLESKYEKKLFLTDRKEFLHKKYCFVMQDLADYILADHRMGWYKKNPKTNLEFYKQFDFYTWFNQ